MDFGLEAGRTTTANGVHFYDMITQFFVKTLQGVDVNSMWFQPDGATCHTTRETVQLLYVLKGRHKFRLIVPISDKKVDLTQ